MRRHLCRLERLATLAEDSVSGVFRRSRAHQSGLRMGGKFVVTQKAAKRFPLGFVQEAVEKHQAALLVASSQREAKAKGGVTTFVTTFRWRQYGLRIVSDLATRTTTIGTVGELPVEHSRYR